jgi:hypothetical protein
VNIDEDLTVGPKLPPIISEFASMMMVNLLLSRQSVIRYG